MEERRLRVPPVKVITEDNRSRLGPAEMQELQKLYELVSEGRTVSGQRMFNNMLKHLNSRQWALLDRYYFGFHMGPGPQFPINCYRQSFMGYHTPDV